MHVAPLTKKNEQKKKKRTYTIYLYDTTFSNVKRELSFLHRQRTYKLKLIATSGLQWKKNPRMYQIGFIDTLPVPFIKLDINDAL